MFVPGFQIFRLGSPSFSDFPCSFGKYKSRRACIMDDVHFAAPPSLGSPTLHHAEAPPAAVRSAPGLSAPSADAPVAAHTLAVQVSSSCAPRKRRQPGWHQHLLNNGHRAQRLVARGFRVRAATCARATHARRRVRAAWSTFSTRPGLLDITEQSERSSFSRRAAAQRRSESAEQRCSGAAEQRSSGRRSAR